MVKLNVYSDLGTKKGNNIYIMGTIVNSVCEEYSREGAFLHKHIMRFFFFLFLFFSSRNPKDFSVKRKAG